MSLSPAPVQCQRFSVSDNMVGGCWTIVVEKVRWKCLRVVLAMLDISDEPMGLDLHRVGAGKIDKALVLEWSEVE